ncbi:DUF5666 domain-containing protein [Alteromonas ponticola]|uniref:DUF5666 domain-containing protein n=1 Tax=Alteromonas aquimaris TaxID=2998417 RepID=A0ABT3P8C6_9ALTE|nr:DUF5666 domain-containing protein [Alteromonas aquimaris]MCW8109033.1 DUF5666 domain-containing protein [Alteromonas aquimaris]
MTYRNSLLAITIATALTACGGGDSAPPAVEEAPAPTVPAPAPTPAPTASPTVTQGVITGFGSVYVNGKRYVSDSASFTIAGQSGAQESGLKMGMVVKVKATEGEEGQDPEASEIEYEETLQGIVSLIDYGNARLTILGQAVYFDDLTEFENVDPAQLSIGDMVEISGYVTESGFYATYVELEAEEDEIKLAGSVSALNTEAQTFSLGQLTVNYSEASFDDMLAGDLRDGLVVKVKGSVYDIQTQTLTAIEVENKEPDVENDFDDVDEVEIAGVVTSYDSAAGTFKVNRYNFVLNDETEFEEGALENFAGNLWVKVEGSRDGDTFVAEQIEFKERKNNGKSEGQVTAVDGEAETFVINGITFTANADTQYEDESEQNERRFTFDDIVVNDILKVASRELPDSTVLALKVKRIDEDDREGEVKGVVKALTLEGMTVAGVAVLFDENTEFETDEGDITAEQFLTLAEGNTALIVEVEGEYGELGLIATEVEVRTNRDNDDQDEDDGKADKVELEGLIEAINGESVIVAGYELRFDQESELEFNDDAVSLETFLSSIAVGDALEFTGLWVEDTYIRVLEAEAETAAE